LQYRINDKSLAAKISIPVFEVPIVDGQIFWAMAENGQVVNVTIMPDGTFWPVYYDLV
jgi:hypothetical protein